eukprot:jgi/Chrzof1/13883/Cz08g16010.t1
MMDKGLGIWPLQAPNNYHPALPHVAVHAFMQIDVADNIDLMTIVQEFVDYYHSKFGRYPKLVRQTFGDFQMPTTVPLQAVSLTPTHPNPSVHLPAVALAQALALQQQAAGVPPPPTSSGSLSNVMGCTCRAGTSDAIDQEEFVAMLSQPPQPVSPSAYFAYKKPSKTNSRKRSATLAINELQEDTLYALVGCLNVGWSIKNITQDTRDFLSSKYAIDKDMIQLFFKNRAQKVKQHKANK